MEDLTKKELTREDLLRIVDEKTEVIRHFIEVSEEYKAKYEDRRDRFNEMCDHYRELEAENKELKDKIEALKGTLNAKNEEIEKLRKKNDDQRIQLNSVQQALLNRNMKIEALNGEVDRLKKEVKERRIVFEPTSYMIDIQAKDEEIKALRKKNLDLKNENEIWKLKYDHLADEIEALKKENEDLRTKLAYAQEEADGAIQVKNETDRLNANVFKSLKDEIEALKEINKKLQEDYDSLKLTYSLMKLNPGYFTPPTPPIHIENFNVTYYENGPVWTNEED